MRIVTKLILLLDDLHFHAKFDQIGLDDHLKLVNSVEIACLVMICGDQLDLLTHHKSLCCPAPETKN